MTTEAYPILLFKDQDAWKKWLDKNHAQSSGLWLRLAKKTSGIKSVSYLEAIEVALCYGWIDGQKKSDDEQHWLQKFTPRRKKSIWSKINKDKAILLIETGKMQIAGLQEIELAKKDGRWDKAYDSARTATVPEDLQEAFSKSPEAEIFFKTLESHNRYAILFRLQNAKKAETRAKLIEKFIGMLLRQEKVHP